ncbi:vacuole membrane protein 1 [Scaptodrosophila lebanonensis]|uniref:Vacuole membrane protein 1 n=1 Tax=Drosophila lebanonensis TaxID=7225 RepID=A0A6J2TAM2_DROLE|nr:vacuole membrane protein 1 [Scaptodrosophila lebanonensis]
MEEIVTECPVAPHPNDKEHNSIKNKKHVEAKSLVMWRRPIQTLKYSILETYELILAFVVKLLDHRLLAVLLILVLLHILPGPQKLYIRMVELQLGFIAYWLILGVLSAIGFGTGLHTFLLYLGPHIAGVTLAAYECQTLNFPAPPYPENKICPDEPYKRLTPTIWGILYKVRFEALVWGLGTSLGEIPPYYMTRAARLCQRDESEELKTENCAIFEKTKLLMECVVQRLGFFGILACASVPNPFFDLAGVACGHFQVPFWKFFGAIIIGKAIFKNYIQQIFVIVTFNEQLVGHLLDLLEKVPLLGIYFQMALKNMLISTKQQMHRKSKGNTAPKTCVVARAFEFCAYIMLSYFAISIVHFLAQRYFNRLQAFEHRKRNSDEIDVSPPQEIQNSSNMGISV